MAKEQVLVPDIGGAEDAEVVEVLVAVGDQLELEQSLIVLESDKASMEIPSSVAGTLLELLVKEGDKLAEGAAIAVVETGAGEAEAPDERSAAGAAAESAAAEAEGDRKEAKQTGEAKAAVPPGGEDGSEAVSESAEGTAEAGAGAGENAPASIIVVTVPDIGTDDAVDLVEVSVAAGDQVDEGDSLIVLESDKASMEVPAPQAGEVVELLVSAGEALRKGDAILRLRPAQSAAGSGPEKSPSPPPAETRTAPPAATPAAQASGSAAAAAAPKPADSPSRGVYAGPAVRKLARELGVDLARVSGSGPKGRLLKEDLHQFVQKAMTGSQATGPASGIGIPPIPEVDFSAFGEVRVEARSKLDKLTAANMQRSWLNVPHVTQFDESDITELETFRNALKPEAEQRGTRLTPMPFLLKACAVALRRHPKLNASLTDGGEALAFKEYVHIGMAVDTPAGLMVPVLRNVDQKSLWEIAAEVIELATLARDRKLKPGQMQGGCFTISSLGGIGGNGFTPIVNAPEVGILGVSRAAVKPVWDGSAFQPRTMLPLALSYDHRVINGGDAGRFLTELVALLGDIRRILL